MSALKIPSIDTVGNNVRQTSVIKIIVIKIIVIKLYLLNLPAYDMSTAQEDYQRHAADDDTFEARMADRIYSKMRKHITEEVKDTLQENRTEIAEWTSKACSSSFKEMSADAAKDQRRLTLKRKGNQKQLEHELAVKAEIQGALDLMEKNDMEKAKQRLEKGMSFVDTRIKHIKLADREPLGWAVVRHYESDALADDSADEKEIEKARKAAATEAKTAESKRAKLTKKPAPYRQTPRHFTTLGKNESSRGKNNIVCFACNKYGHMKKDCNFLRSRSFKNLKQNYRYKVY